MGYIYQFNCTKCTKVEGEVFYGIGMKYPENSIDTRLHGCNDCGEVFPRNINKRFNRCPKCKKKSFELKFHKVDEIGFWKELKTPVNCPNCKEGIIQLEVIGNWD